MLPAGAQRYTRVRRMVLVGDEVVIAGRAKAVSTSGNDYDPEKTPSDFLLVRLGKGSPPVAGPGTPVPPTTGCATSPVKVRSATLVGCFTQSGGTYTAKEGTILMNGTRLDLLGGSRLVAVPGKGTIATAAAGGKPGVARISAITPTGAVVQVSRGPIKFTVPAGGGSRAATLRDGARDPCAPIGSSIGTVSTEGVGNLLGFPLPGAAKLSTAAGKTYIQVNVALPKPAFIDATGCATLETTSTGGLQLDSLYIAVGTASLGPLQLGKIAISYTGASDTWKGTLTVTLPMPKQVEVTGTVTFTGGAFGAATVGIEFPTAVPIFPAIGLKGVFGGIQIKPSFAISAGVHLIAGPSLFGQAAIDANLLGTISFPGKPYALAIDITGEVRVVSIPLASASVHYDSGGTFFMKGRASFDAYVLGIEVEVEGGVQSPHFYVSGSATADLGLGSIKAAGLISEVGAAACGGFVNPIKDAALGFSIKWGHGPDFFTSCDLSPFKTFFAAPTPNLPQLRVDAFTPRAVAERTFTVAPGTKALGLKVSGAQTPLITVLGPNGERIDGPTASTAGPVRPQDIARSPAGAVIAYRPSSASYVALTRPAPGTWRVVSQLGTAPITSVAQSTVIAQPKVTASVRGRSRSRTLVFRTTPRAGQTVAFVERAAKLEHAIGEVRRGAKAGTLRFSPGDGRGGRRRVYAQVSQNGVPRKSMLVATYTAPGPAIPGGVRSLRLRVSGKNAVRATWKAVRGVKRYVVRFRLKDGHARTVIVRATARPAARTAAFLPKRGGTVSVAAVSSRGISGSKRTATLKAVKG